MKIVYFHWAKTNGPSIGRSFAPLIKAIAKNNDVEEYYVPYSGSLPWNLWRNICFIRKHSTKTGINHITGDIHYGVLGLIGRISVLTIHDDYAMVTAHRGWFDKIYKFLFWIWLPVKLATKVLCITEETKRKIEHWVKSPNMIVLANHSLDTLFPYAPKEIDKTNLRLLQIGTGRQKNLERTMKVAAKLDRPYHLRVVVKMTESQKKLANDLGINYSNVFNISDEQIVEEYKKADIVLFPSLFEGFGMPPIEAQTVGRAVITTNREPMKSVSGGKSCAVLLDDPLDENEYLRKLEHLIDDDQYRHTLIENGRKNAKRFNLSKVVDNFLNFYNHLLIDKNRVLNPNSGGVK